MHTVSRPLALALALTGFTACADRSGPPPEPPLGIRLVDPSPGAFAGSRLTVQVAVEGTPDAVELWRDGALVASLGALRRIALDTAPVPEGTHQLVARARLGERVAESDVVEFTVDHTPPVVLSRGPLLDAPEGWDGAVTLQLSEPVTALVRPENPLLQGDASQPLQGTLTVSPSGTEVRIDVLNLAVAFTDAVNVTQPELVDRAGNVADRLDWGFWLPPLQATLVSPPPGTAVVTNGVARLEARVAGAPVRRVEFRVGAQVHVVTSGPPWRLDLDISTSALSEGTWPITAVAYRGQLGAESASAELVIDRTPPRLLTSGPAVVTPEGAARAAPVTFTFTEPLAPESVAAAVTSSGSCGAVLQVPPAPEATVTLTATGAVDCADEVEVSGALTDLAGNHLAAPVSVRVDRPAWFRTGPSTPASSSVGATLAIDRQGRSVVAWTEVDGITPPRVRVAVLDGRTSIELPDLAAAVGWWGASAADLAADPAADRLWLAVGVTEGSHTTLHLAAFEGGAWRDLGPLEVAPERDLSGAPSVAADGRGGAWVGWHEAQVTWPDVSVDSATFVRHFDGAAWGQPEPISAPRGFASGDPRVAIGADRTAVVAWFEWVLTASDSHREIFMRRLDTPFPEIVQVSPPGTLAAGHDVLVGADGTVVVSWVEGEGAPQLVRVARWDGLGWTPVGDPVALAPDHFAGALRLAPDGDGLLMAWTEYPMDQLSRGPHEVRLSGGAWVEVPGVLAADQSWACSMTDAAGAPGVTPAIAIVGSPWPRVQVIRENR